MATINTVFASGAGCGCGCTDCRCLAPASASSSSSKKKYATQDEAAPLLLSPGAVPRRCACCCARCQHDTHGGGGGGDDDEWSSDDEEDGEGRGEVVVAVWPVACGGCAAVLRQVAERRLTQAGCPPPAPSSAAHHHPPPDPKSKGRGKGSRVRVGQGGRAALRVKVWGATLNVDKEAQAVGRAVAADLLLAGFASAEVVPHSDAAPLLPAPSHPSSFASPKFHARRPFLLSVQVLPPPPGHSLPHMLQRPRAGGSPRVCGRGMGRG